MISGIGVDSVYIPEVRRCLSDEKLSFPFVRRTFTQAEQAAAADHSDLAEYYSARFAAKEAVFKALGCLTSEKTFDFRLVETLNMPDGSPYVNITDALRHILLASGVRALHISITTEADYATAFVIAES